MGFKIFFFLLRFTINFQTGKNEGDDIAFSINPQVGDVVALNSFRNGNWETKEHASVTVFSKEAALNMIIVINSEEYEVCFSKSACKHVHKKQSPIMVKHQNDSCFLRSM